MSATRVIALLAAVLALGVVAVLVIASLKADPPGPNRPYVATMQDVAGDPPPIVRQRRHSALQMHVAGASRYKRQVVGRSVEGRPIVLEMFGNPRERPRILVFGCIHGTECAGSRIPIADSFPLPTWDLAIFEVPNLNPDGFAEGSRLNGRGVDLNRNFLSGWRPIGARGSPQFSGPRPFSEPETRIAARLIRDLDPRVTVWFHQQANPLVRAWGPSVAAARKYARLIGLPFRRLPWLDGTAPNWQNHRFPGTSSFVVELPPGPLSQLRSVRFGAAGVVLARSIAVDRPRPGRDGRRGDWDLNQACRTYRGHGSSTDRGAINPRIGGYRSARLRRRNNGRSIRRR